jgi:hypothetical protein
VSPVQIIAMKMERRTLARLRRSCGISLPDDGRPGAGPGLVLLGVAGAASALLLGYVLAGAL